MDKVQITVTFSGMESSDALRDFAIKKLTKHENLLGSLTTGEIILSSSVSERGVKTDFRIDVNFFLSGRKIHVEEIGEDMYAMIDSASDKLFRRLKRYHDKQNQWEGETPWKVVEANEELEALEEENLDNDIANYESYTPKVAVRKNIQDMSPLAEAEAIELMELSGYNQYLFRNKENNKMCMVYKRERGDYGMVEPADTL